MPGASAIVKKFYNIGHQVVVVETMKTERKDSCDSVVAVNESDDEPTTQKTAENEDDDKSEEARLVNARKLFSLSPQIS